MRVRRGHEVSVSEFAAVIATMVAATARQAWVQETESALAEQPQLQQQPVRPLAHPPLEATKSQRWGDSDINDAAVAVTGVRVRVVV